MNERIRQAQDAQRRALIKAGVSPEAAAYEVATFWYQGDAWSYRAHRWAEVGA